MKTNLSNCCNAEMNEDRVFNDATCSKCGKYYDLASPEVIEKKRDLTCCFDLIDQAERVGRCHYVCKNCKKDVSLLWFFYQQAL